MRQLWVSLLLLAAVSAVLLWTGQAVEELAGELTADLPRAMEAAERGDWPLAQDLSRQAEDRWNAAGKWLPLVESHHTIEEIGGLLEETALHAGDRDRNAFRSAVHRSRRALEALAETEKLTPGNLF